MRIALLHYSFWPVIGGVETVMLEHARLFSAAGHEVTVFCGAGQAFARRESEDGSVHLFRTEHLPLESATVVEQGQKSGIPWKISKAVFEERYAKLCEFLSKGLADHDVVFMHNVCTMPFDLPLTAALWVTADALSNVRFVAWVHDLAAGNPDYALGDSSEIPWHLLGRAHSRMEYVTVSERRKRQLLAAFELTDEQCSVVPDGIDPVRQLRLPKELEHLAVSRKWAEHELLLLHPTRLLRRKNVELSLRVTAALRALGQDAALLITGAEDIHNPASVEYAASLHRLHDELELGSSAVFLSDHLPIKAEELSGLYRLADALFFPSRQEGFGLPVLEAAAHRLPAFCADVEPFNALPGAIPFDPEASPEEIAAFLIQRTDASPAIQARKSVVRDFAWSAIWRKCLAPLLSRRPNSNITTANAASP
ncbi:MAG TPA: glycosyltransferase family 4 protein [Chthoniobacteraceae bacterium]